MYIPIHDAQDKIMISQSSTNKTSFVHGNSNVDAEGEKYKMNENITTLPPQTEKTP